MRLKNSVGLAKSGLRKIADIISNKELIFSYLLCYGLIDFLSVQHTIRFPDSIFGFRGELILNTIATYFFCTALYIILEDNKSGNSSLIKKGFRSFLRKALSLCSIKIISGIRILLGTILFIIPGIILSLRYIYTSEVKVIEQINNQQTLRRSTELSKINKWRNIFACIIISLIAILISIFYLSFTSSIGALESQQFLVLYINEMFIGFMTLWLYSTKYVAYNDAKKIHDLTEEEL